MLLWSTMRERAFEASYEPPVKSYGFWAVRWYLPFYVFDAVTPNWHPYAQSASLSSVGDCSLAFKAASSNSFIEGSNNLFIESLSAKHR